jgi:hypothetical protein
MLAPSCHRKHFGRTWILWRAFPYWLREWHEGHIHIIPWLDQGCCFCEWLQHWKILAGKFLTISHAELFMNSQFIFILLMKNLRWIFWILTLRNLHEEFCLFKLRMAHFQARGPQCALYVPAPILRLGDNIIVCTFSFLHYCVLWLPSYHCPLLVTVYYVK